MSSISKHIPGTKAHEAKKQQEEFDGYNRSPTYDNNNGYDNTTGGVHRSSNYYSDPQGVSPQGTHSQGTYQQRVSPQGTHSQGTHLPGADSRGTHSLGTHTQGTYTQGANPQGTQGLGTVPEGAYTEGTHTQRTHPLRSNAGPGMGSGGAYDDMPSGIEETVNPSSGAGTAGGSGVRQSTGPNVNATTGYGHGHGNPLSGSKSRSPTDSGGTGSSRVVDTTRSSYPDPVGSDQYQTRGQRYEDAQRPGHDGYDSMTPGQHNQMVHPAYKDGGMQRYGNRETVPYTDDIRAGSQHLSRDDYYKTRTAGYGNPAFEASQDHEDFSSRMPATNMTQSTTITTPSGYTTTTTTTPHTSKPHPEERNAVAGAMQSPSVTSSAVGVVKGVQAKTDRIKDEVNRRADQIGERAAQRKYGNGPGAIEGADPAYRSDVRS